MSESNSTMEDLYQYYLSLGDKRVESWPLMKTPMKTFSLLIVYLVSLHYIKKSMEKRKPYELKWFLIGYNFLQVCGSFYIFYELLSVAILSKYSLVCQVVDYSNDPLPTRIASALWFYYISKLADLIDTIVFALRKKDRQITFLHVFHHVTMFPYAWVGLKYVGGGQTFFLCMLNSFVHTVMYAYYGLSACGPSVQKYLWWKKYITIMQLTQFFLVMGHSIINVFADCAFPKAFSISYLCYGIIITALFTNFYIQSYTKTGAEKSASTSSRATKSSNKEKAIKQK